MSIADTISSFSSEEKSLFRPFTRESLRAIEQRIAEDHAKQKELEEKRAEGEVSCFLELWPNRPESVVPRSHRYILTLTNIFGNTIYCRTLFDVRNETTISFKCDLNVEFKPELVCICAKF